MSKTPTASEKPAVDDAQQVETSPPKQTRRMSIAALKESSPQTIEMLAFVSARIQEARQQQHLSLSKLARAASLPISTIFSAESGNNNISLGTLLKIAEALNLQVRDLLPGKDEPKTDGEGASVSKIVEGCLETVLVDHQNTAKRIEQTLTYIASLRQPPTSAR